MFEWSLLAVLVIYWFELGVELLFAALKGVFAERPPMYDGATTEMLVTGALARKRGGVQLPFVDPQLRVANLPAVTVAVFGFGVLWLFVGGVGIGGVSEATETPVGTQALASAVLGLIGVVVGETVDAAGYVLDRTYQEIPVQAALHTPIVSVIGIGTALLFGGIAVDGGVPTFVVLVAVIGVKLLVDVGRVYRDRLVAFDEQDQLDFGFAGEYDEWPTVDTELTGTVETLRPRRGALFVDGVVRGLRSPVLLIVGGFGLLLALIGFWADNWAVLRLLAQIVAGISCVFAGLGVVDRACRAFWLRYDIAGDAVAGDRLFGPQWRVPEECLSDATVTRTVADRLFGTTTLVVDAGDRSVRLRHLPVSNVDGCERTSG